MKDEDSIRLVDLQLMESSHPHRKNLTKHLLGFTSREEFLEILYPDIIRAFSHVEKNSNHLSPDALSEDHISTLVCDVLIGMFYNPVHGENANGETDIIIKSFKGEFECIAEAKIYHSCPYLYGGFEQLTTRYTKGRPKRDDSGAIFIYCIKKRKIAEKMEKWETELVSMQREKYGVENISKTTKGENLDFYSTHQHNISGKNFTTWHVPLMLTFEPSDKSARESAKYQSAGIH